MVSAIVIGVIIAIVVCVLLCGVAIYKCFFAHGAIEEDFHRKRRQSRQDMQDNYARQQLHNKLVHNNPRFNPQAPATQDKLMFDSVSVAASSISNGAYLDTKSRQSGVSNNKSQISDTSHFYPGAPVSNNTQQGGAYYDATIPTHPSNHIVDSVIASGQVGAAHTPQVQPVSAGGYSLPLPLEEDRDVASNSIRFNDIILQPETPKFQIAIVEFNSPNTVTGGNDKGADGHRIDSIAICNGIISRGSGCQILSYSYETHSEFEEDIVSFDAIIVRFHPSQLMQATSPAAFQFFDKLMREQENEGKIVWTSPNVRTLLEGRDALIALKDLRCGLADTYAYADAESFAAGLKTNLAHKPRVLRKKGGFDGHDVWLCWLEEGKYCGTLGQSTLNGSEVVKLMEMNDNHVEYHTVDELIAFCVGGPGDDAGEWTSTSWGGYLESNPLDGEGLIVDQRLLTRVMEGKLRVVMVGDVLQEIVLMENTRGLSTVEALATSTSFPAKSPQFAKFEKSFLEILPEITHAFGFDVKALPLLWTIDLIANNRGDEDDIVSIDTDYIVCGLDTACVSIPKLQAVAGGTKTLSDVSDLDYWKSIPLANLMAIKAIAMLEAKEKELLTQDFVADDKQEEDEEEPPLPSTPSQAPQLFWHQLSPLQKAIRTLREKAESAIANPDRTALALDLLTEEYLDSMSERKQAELLQCCREAIDFPSFCRIGCRVSRASDYANFEPFFKRLITAMSNYPAEESHPMMSWVGPTIPSPTSNRFKSSPMSSPTIPKNFNTMHEITVHLHRNFKGFPMSSRMTKAERIALEEKVVKILTSDENPNRIAGVYRSLTPGHPMMIKPDELRSLCEVGAAFPDAIKDSEDLFGATRDWPHGRGCFISNELTVWVGLENHIQIRCTKLVLSTEEVRTRVETALRLFEEDGNIPFEHSSKFGWITSSPSHVGTGFSMCGLGIVLPSSITLDQVKEVANQTQLKGQLRQQFSNATAWTFEAVSSFGVTEGLLLHRLETAVKMFESITMSPKQLQQQKEEQEQELDESHPKRETSVRSRYYEPTTSQQGDLSLSDATAHLLKRSASVKQRVEQFLNMQDSDDEDDGANSPSQRTSPKFMLPKTPVNTSVAATPLAPPIAEATNETDHRTETGTTNENTDEKDSDGVEVSSVYSFDMSKDKPKAPPTSNPTMTAPPPPPQQLQPVSNPPRTTSSAPKRKIFDLTKSATPIESPPPPTTMTASEGDEPTPPTPSKPEYELDANGKPIAPTVDKSGVAIPEWRQKIKQKRLDIEWEQEQEENAEKVATEKRWEGVPAWKRAFLEKKEQQDIQDGLAGRTSFSKP
eukprot:m.223139 g.223139  ORF g.223139 m.223139 type:complete len:1329 (-) comp33391_c2_seq2:98-4084(-)